MTFNLSMVMDLWISSTNKIALISVDIALVIGENKSAAGSESPACLLNRHKLYLGGFFFAKKNRSIKNGYMPS